MRTTLTLDDDLAVELRRLAAAMNRSFKDTLNEVLRRGLRAGTSPEPPPEPFVVRPHEGGLVPGIDATKLTQLADELSVRDAAARGADEES